MAPAPGPDLDRFGKVIVRIVELAHLGFFINPRNRTKIDVPDRGTVSLAPAGDAAMERDEVAAIRSVCPTEALTETVRRLLLTFTLEDYYQAEAFREVIRPDHWYRFDPRIVEAARAALGLLQNHGVRSTFFVSAWVADRFPGLVAEVVEHGHEVAMLAKCLGNRES